MKRPSHQGEFDDLLAADLADRADSAYRAFADWKHARIHPDKMRELQENTSEDAVLLAAKIRALFDGRFAASGDDVRAMALPALRHRVLLNFEGEAEGIRSDQVIEQITKSLPEGKR